MLVLSRKYLEKIVIPFTAQTLRSMVAMIPEGTKDDDPTPITQITTTLVEIRGEVVRLGIDAPQCVPVHRQEVYEQIRKSEKK